MSHALTYCLVTSRGKIGVEVDSTPIDRSQSAFFRTLRAVYVRGLETCVRQYRRLCEDLKAILNMIAKSKSLADTFMIKYDLEKENAKKLLGPDCPDLQFRTILLTLQIVGRMILGTKYEMIAA